MVTIDIPDHINILKDFRNAPFYIHCLFQMADLRMFHLLFFILLHNGPWFAMILICSCCSFWRNTEVSVFQQLSSDKCEFNYSPHSEKGRLYWIFIAPTLKKGGYTKPPLWKGGGGGLSWIWVVCHPFRQSSIRHNFIYTQYLENKLIEFHKILCMHWYW